MPDSQCPALPAQHGIVSTLFKEALAMRNGSAATNRHTKHNTPSERNLCFLCFFEAIWKPNYSATSFGTGYTCELEISNATAKIIDRWFSSVFPLTCLRHEQEIGR